MAAQGLRAILGRKSKDGEAVREVCLGVDPTLCVIDSAGSVLLGEMHTGTNGSARHHPIVTGDSTLGHVIGSGEGSLNVARFLSHLADRATEQRAMASETLTLYREIHLIEQLSEELNGLLDTARIGELALAQAKRLIPASRGAVLIRSTEDAALTACAAFNDLHADEAPIAADSRFIASVLERGTAEIVNSCADDPRASGPERVLHSLVLAPLRAGKVTVGVMVLANEEAASYSAANLKLINTIALQTATAMRNAMLCAEMVETARTGAAYAAELQAASSVQQMLLQAASRPTPGFHVESVYLPASEVGGDFFFVQPCGDGSLLAIVGDVSGKGLTAAMHVSMILGALRREISEDPGDILTNLNNVLVSPGQSGFTTACCVRIWPGGTFTFANAGHISPYLSGHEINADPALPLGIVAGQTYQPVHGTLRDKDQIVLVSDGVPEARSGALGLLGFERLAELSVAPAAEIAHAAQAFGQEDDITVLALRLAR